MRSLFDCRREWILRVLIFAVPLIYFGYSLNWNGPAYLSDEIAYLNKASALGGHSVEGSSSWHAGYSFFLAPLFYYIDSPSLVWLCAMGVNAAFWVGSFALINYFIKKVFPDESLTNRFLTLTLVAIYPAWITISGYVFPSSAFVFFFLLSVVQLLRWIPNYSFSIVLHSLSTGYLYWVHPTGLGVAIASIFAVAVATIQSRRYDSFIIHIVVVLALILVYHWGVHPWLNGLMVSDQFPSRQHYPDIAMMLEKVVSISFWQAFFAKVMGQVSYLVVASFGLVVLGIRYLILQASQSIFDKNDAEFLNAALAVYLLFALFFIVFAGAALFVLKDAARTDHWIYGRYAEGALLPILAVGYLGCLRHSLNSKLKMSLIIALTLVVFGWLIDRLGDSSASPNLVNIIAFWPFYLLDTNMATPFLGWMLVGAVGVGLAMASGRYGVLFLMAMSLALSLGSQHAWHKNILSGHSKPSLFLDYIHNSVRKGSCVGFEFPLPKGLSYAQVERFNLYSFYLYNYELKKISGETWLRDCNGPLLTYYSDKYIGMAEVEIVARETASNLFLVTRVDDAEQSRKMNLAWDASAIFARNKNDPCLFAGCLAMTAADLARFSQVGYLDDDSLVSTGTPGYLFFGPYQSLKEGMYVLTLEGDFSQASDVILDVVSDKGTKVHFKSQLCDSGCRDGRLVFGFPLAADTQDLEIRMQVSADSVITVHRYRITDAKHDH